MERAVYDLDEASNFLRVSQATLRAWKRQGRGPVYFQAGKLLRYRRADLEAWIRARLVAPDEDKQ